MTHEIEAVLDARDAGSPIPWNPHGSLARRVAEMALPPCECGAEPVCCSDCADANYNSGMDEGKDDLRREIREILDDARKDLVKIAEDLELAPFDSDHSMEIAALRDVAQDLAKI